MFLISSHCSSTLSLCQVPGPINSSVNEAMQGLAALMGELNCSRVSIGAAMTGGGSLPSNIGMWRNTKHGVAICLMMSYLSSHGYLCDIVYVNIYIYVYVIYVYNMFWESNLCAFWYFLHIFSFFGSPVVRPRHGLLYGPCRAPCSTALKVRNNHQSAYGRRMLAVENQPFIAIRLNH